MEEKDIKIIKKIVKSMHKSFCKALSYNEKKKQKGKGVVADILDPNYVAEADPKEIPARRTGVMYKSKKKDGKGKLYTRADVAKKAAEVVLNKYKNHKKDNL